MNHVEFSNSFDILYNNLMSNAAPGINEYEKSVLLTKAQDELIKNYFNPSGNKYKEGFDGSAKRQIDFSALITSGVCDSLSGTPLFDSRAKKYKLPEDILIVLNEFVETNNGVKQVLPINFKEYTRLMSKPYKEPLKNHVWRLIVSGVQSGDSIIEIIPRTGDSITNYKIRYIRKPKPIILVDLKAEYGEGVSIEGFTDISECELNDSIHEEILQRAVELAKVVYTGDANGLLQIGQRSE